MQETVDLLIQPRWIIPIEPERVVLENHAVAVRDRRILAVMPQTEALRRFAPRERIDLPQHVLIPGLVNLHTHAAMALMRGLADDLTLMTWLRDHIWPAEAKHVSPAFVRDGTLLACAEMLRGGITCFNDMYFFPEAAAQAASRFGMRAVLGIVVIDFPTAYASDAEDYLTKGLATRDAWRENTLVSFCIAPHAPYTVGDRSFERILTLAEQLQLPLHIHLHETQDEVTQGVAQHGVRPLERLRRLGLLGPGVIAVHAVHLEPREIQLLAEHACSIAHCPTSNMKLASGAAPVAEALRQGVRVGLGTDGAASNNRLDLFQEMRHASLLAKVTSGDATVLDSHTVLRMATLNAAAALGMENHIGSIESHKAADLVAIRLDAIEVLPCFDPASHLVHVAGREHVTHVWVDGALRVADGVLQKDDMNQLIATANLWQNRLGS